ncbi:MAG: prepilin-type N-terminal cleavage/methylation domain-containing protein [Phycisphaerales bacterium JB059]
MSGRSTRSRAFTLLEVLLALALLAGVTGGALGLLGNLSLRQTQIRRHHDRAIDAGLVIDRLEGALATSFAADVSGEPGVRGDDHSIEVRSRGVVGHAGAFMGDRRRFALHWDAGAGELEINFDADGVEGSGEILPSPVERLRLRYFRGARWRSSYDSAQAGELPGAVEIAIWFARPEEPEFVEAGEPDDIEALLDAAEAEGMGDEPLTRAPDRLRVMVIPDAPSVSWEVGG